MSKTNAFLHEKYLFQLLNALEWAYLAPTSVDQNIAYRNMKRYLAQAEEARRNLNLIVKISNLKHDAKMQNIIVSYNIGSC